MIELKEFLSEKKVPNWIANNSILKSFDKVDKIFPKIGLPNCQEECIIDNKKIITDTAINLINVLRYQLSEPGYRMTSYEVYHPNANISREVSDEIYYWGWMMQRICDHLLEYDTKNFLSSTNNRISLNIKDNITDINNNLIFRRGEGFFRIYNKIYNNVSKLKCGERIPKLDNIPEFKRFSIDNLPNNKFYIVFSSDKTEGLWDITTMSMRGITSCQSWNGQYRSNLIGSMLDPFFGIIYLTTGSKYNEYGTKMVKRSVVRFVIDGKNHRPCLVIDRMYPEWDSEIFEKFKEFIVSKTNNKFDVYYGPTIPQDIYEKSYIPHSSIYDKLDLKTASYKDTKIPIGKHIYSSRLTNIRNKKTALKVVIQKIAFTSASDMNVDVNSLSNSEKVKEFLSFIIQSPDFKFIMRDFYLSITIKHFNLHKEELFGSSNDYMKKIIFQFLMNRNRISSLDKSLLVKKLNKYFDAKSYDTRINSKNINPILDKISTNIDCKLKQEFRALVFK